VRSRKLVKPLSCILDQKQQSKWKYWKKKSWTGYKTKREGASLRSISYWRGRRKRGRMVTGTSRVKMWSLIGGECCHSIYWRRRLMPTLCMLTILISKWQKPRKWRISNSAELPWTYARLEKNSWAQRRLSKNRTSKQAKNQKRPWILETSKSNKRRTMMGKTFNAYSF